MNFLYLLMLSLLLISTSAVSMSGRLDEIKQKFSPNIKVKAYSDIPILRDGASYPVLSSQSVLAVDLISGVTLYEKDPLKHLLPASTTKIVTALVALDAYEPKDVLRIGKIKVEGQKMGLLEGEEITFESLLEGLLIYSANDAAEALAQNYPGGRDSFINMMNVKAQELGLPNTHFTNPAGLDDINHYSTAKDLIIVSKVAMLNPLFADIVGTKEKVISSTDGRFNHRLSNINKLLGTVDGVKGVKTGWTENARENLVTYIDRNGRKVMIVVLGSSDRFGETKELIDWIYSNYTWQGVAVNTSY